MHTRFVPSVAALAVFIGCCLPASSQPLLRYPFNGPPADGVTLNLGSFVPGAHPLLGHDEICAAPNLSPSALAGNGVAGSEVTTGFPTAFLTILPWTVGFCIRTSGIANPTSLMYVFGDASTSWRIFTGGVAGAGNILMRTLVTATSNPVGFADTNIAGGAGSGGWVHVAWVYDPTVPECRGYLNGVLNVTVAQPAYGGLGISATNLSVGRYPSSTATLRPPACMEDFRLYNRALVPAEIGQWAAGACAGTQGGWVGDDGFNVACCEPAEYVNLPVFPSFTLAGCWCCMHNCNLEATYNVTVTTSHTPLLCDYASVGITVAGCPSWTSGSPYPGLEFLAKYSRTWTEPGPTPTLPQRQVWRFLLNGLLAPPAPLPAGCGSPCPYPPHPAGATTHFTGHIDYACDSDPANPGGSVFRAALNLNHLPGCLTHTPLPPFGPPLLAGAAAHPDRSYHLIAPDTFVPASVPEPAGALVGEAVRSTTIFPAYTCLCEAPVVGGSLITVSSGCLCLPAAGAFPYKFQSLGGGVVCGGVVVPFTSLALPQPLGFFALPLGTWVGAPGVFPATRDLIVYSGFLHYDDPCNPPDFPFHSVVGVATRGGGGNVLGGPHNACPCSTFLDLQNSLDLASGLTLPTWSELFVAKIVWNLNL